MGWETIGWTWWVGGWVSSREAGLRSDGAVHEVPRLQGQQVTERGAIRRPAYWDVAATTGGGRGFAIAGGSNPKNGCTGRIYVRAIT